MDGATSAQMNDCVTADYNVVMGPRMMAQLRKIGLRVFAILHATVNGANAATKVFDVASFSNVVMAIV